MKLSTIAQRCARKDFCDLYALGKTSFSLQQMLGFYQKKFGIRDIASVLYGLIYFDDAESERMPRMLWNVNWRDIKKMILEWVKGICGLQQPLIQAKHLKIAKFSRVFDDSSL